MDTKGANCEVDGCKRFGVERDYGVTCNQHDREFTAWENDYDAGTYAAKEPDTAQLEMKGDVDPEAFLMGYLAGSGPNG